MVRLGRSVPLHWDYDRFAWTASHMYKRRRNLHANVFEEERIIAQQ